MKLSIITVCLNSRAYLERTIKSVLGQTWKDFEYIVIDGKSNDGTDVLLKKYEQNIQKILSEPDSGVYNAQNKGIRISEGEYLLFLNAGDVFVDDDSLKVFFSTTIERFDLLYGDIILEENGRITGKHQYPDKIPLSYWKSNFLCHQAVFHSRSLFEKHGFYNENNRYASDHEFFFKIWLDPNSRIRHINQYIIVYNLNGLTGNPETREKVLGEYRPILKKYLGFDFQTESSLARKFRKLRDGISKIINFRFS